jgi:type III pantothenate kinase
VILELDLGNTRGKWRIVAGADVVDRGAGEVAVWSGGDFPASWRDVSRVRIGSVLGETAEQALLTALSALGVSVAFARSSAECAGVRNAYVEPQKLGVDRWLAMLAAHREFRRAVLVVDVGSALTLDLVDAAGLHRGGYIIPGARLMADALLQSTDRVRFAASDAPRSIALGVNTGDCVFNGINLALVGAVQLGFEQAQAALGDVLLVLAGGDAGVVEASSSRLFVEGDNFHRRPDLVLDGLGWALP